MERATVPVPRPRILIADDDRGTLLVVANALKVEFEVVTVSSGAEAIARAGPDIALILLDVSMPGLGGFEVCAHLKSHADTAGIPVIFVTGLEDPMDETRGFASGGVDYIAKPIHPAILRARVRTHIELRVARDLLEQLASVDALTGIANRRRFDAAIADEWRRTRRHGRWLSLAMVDVDRFKRFNDRYGHLAGDVCLQGIAASLVKSTRRAGELVARYGGEEFVLVLPDVAPGTMREMLRGLLDEVAAATDKTANPVAHEAVTVSVGAVSLVPALGQNVADVLAIADGHLYEAKAAGGARAVHADLMTQLKSSIVLTELPLTSDH